MKKTSNWDYLWYALYAFAGLGMEVLLLSFVEPMIFPGVNSWKEYTQLQTIIHWLLTIGCWGGIAAYLVIDAKRKVKFNPFKQGISGRKLLLPALLCVLACIALNVMDWGTLKILGEFQKKGLLIFGFQYLYYMFEVLLVYLIVAFGQRFFEGLYPKWNYIPWGGIVLCFTWGIIHMLSQGSIETGLGVMLFSIAFGMLYLCLKRDAKLSYIAMALAFVI